MKYWPWVVVGFVFLALAGIFWGYRETVWRERIADEQAHAETARITANRVVAEYRDKMASLQPVIVERIKRDTLVIRAVTNLPASPAPICDSAIAIRDTVISELATSVTEWKDLMKQQQEASARLLVAADSLRNAETSALHKQIDLYKNPPGSSFLGRLFKPEIRPGAFAGYCVNGVPCAGVGLTLSWKL